MKETRNSGQTPAAPTFTVLANDLDPNTVAQQLRGKGPQNQAFSHSEEFKDPQTKVTAETEETRG